MLKVGVKWGNRMLKVGVIKWADRLLKVGVIKWADRLLKVGVIKWADRLLKVGVIKWADRMLKVGVKWLSILVADAEGQDAGALAAKRAPDVGAAGV